MTRIDFYLLKESNRENRFDFTCRLVERIYGTPDRPRILIHCPEQAQARSLDRLLWSFREESFLPHGLIGETDPLLTPILISGNGEPESDHQVLVNLDESAEVPTFFSRFERLCEPLDQDPAVLNAGRARYAYYRDCGYPLQHHSIG